MATTLCQSPTPRQPTLRTPGAHPVLPRTSLAPRCCCTQHPRREAPHHPPQLLHRTCVRCCSHASPGCCLRSCKDGVYQQQVRDAAYRLRVSCNHRLHLAGGARRQGSEVGSQGVQHICRVQGSLP